MRASICCSRACVDVLSRASVGTELPAKSVDGLGGGRFCARLYKAVLVDLCICVLYA